MTAQSRAAAPAKPRHQHPVNQLHHDEATFGERVADKVGAGIGSWNFLIIQSLVIAVWILLNVIALVRHWDPYPFFLLNFAFSMQAAFTGPVLLLAGNRQAQKDRLMLEHTADKTEHEERTTLKILQEVETNTACTLQILEHVLERKRRAG